MSTNTRARKPGDISSRNDQVADTITSIVNGAEESAQLAEWLEAEATFQADQAATVTQWLEAEASYVTTWLEAEASWQVDLPLWLEAEAKYVTDVKVWLQAKADHVDTTARSSARSAKDNEAKAIADVDTFVLQVAIVKADGLYPLLGAETAVQYATALVADTFGKPQGTVRNRLIERMRLVFPAKGKAILEPISQAKLADVCGTDPATVTRVLRGDNPGSGSNGHGGARTGGSEKPDTATKVETVVAAQVETKALHAMKDEDQVESVIKQLRRMEKAYLDGFIRARVEIVRRGAKVEDISRLVRAAEQAIADQDMRLESGSEGTNAATGTANK